MQAPRIILISVSAAFLIGLPTSFCCGDETLDAKIVPMRERAQSTEVGIVDGQTAELIPNPLFRYSDQPRGIIDGSFWCWQSDGRPIAFQKIEYYDRDDESLRWFYCFASASQQRIHAKWGVGEQWTATAPGVKLQTLTSEPVSDENALRVSFQIKNIARRFSVRLEDTVAGTEEQLRLISRPIYQYGNLTTESMGAVFSFASNGTNPDVLLLIELDKQKSGKTWKYGLLQMTTGKLTARLSDEVVWTAPYRTPSFDRPSKFDSWLFFYESSANK